MEARRGAGCRSRSPRRFRTRASRSEGASSRSLLDTAAAEAAVNVRATRPQEDALRQQQRLRVGYKRRIHIWGALANIMHLDTVKSFIHEYALVQPSYDAGAVETIN